MKTKEIQKIDNGWDFWSNNFYSAKRFFESKGNGNTKSRLKDRWFKQFQKDLWELYNK